MTYNFSEIEKKWQQYWDENKTFYTDVWDFSKPKYYALDMFPYPSGQGLHVGHPEGYTATDIISRMKRMQGYNVLHPMGWDAFGLPAEQYAIKTGNHPAGFTKQNIETFKRQLKMLGFSFDWDKEVSTCDPNYYKWTQWIFSKLYEDGLAKLIEMPVNWCEELGCVLSNDEVINGKSERGGFPVIRKNMKQWVLDIPKYADKLIDGLEEIDWPESTKEIERNWIGKSVGAEVKFKIADNDSLEFTVFTTRPDTLFGATYCVLSPEHELVSKITTCDQIKIVQDYIKQASSKSDLERTDLNKDKTGVFTGSYAINPVNNKKIPIWISDYVLVTYGTGAIMAVPAHDQRDYEFATKFDLPIIQVLEEETGTPNLNEKHKDSIVAIIYNKEEDKYLTLNWHENGGRLFIGGTIKENETPLECAIREIEEETGYTDIKLVKTLPKIHHHYYAYNKNQYFNIDATGFLFTLNTDKKVNQNLENDENFDIEWVSANQIINDLKDDLHYKVFEYSQNSGAMVGDGLHINSDFLNGLNKEHSINKMIKWLEDNNIGNKKVNYKLREWIFARQRYWGEPIPIVFDTEGKAYILPESELPLTLPELEDYSPSKSGASPLDKALNWVNATFNEKSVKRETSTMPGAAGSSWYFLRYIDPKNNNEFANQELLKHWLPVDLYMGGPEHAVGHLLYARFWNQYLFDKGLSPVKEPFAKLRHQGMILGPNGEKMSKSKGNVINPDDMVKEYGADSLRVYEMFMGPIDAAKPWDPNGIDGSKKFLDKVWRLYTESGKIHQAENKNLERAYHYTVKKVTNDYETMNFNTAISQMMIFINSVNKEDVFPIQYAEGFLKLLNPVAPHITEELWNSALSHTNTISYEKWPEYDESKTVNDEIILPIQFNGKLKATITIALDEDEVSIKDKVHNVIDSKLDGKTIVKEIYVKNKIYNIVVK